MKEVIHNLNPEKGVRIPTHIAFIMDGNGRWAKRKGQKRTFGHENGVDTVRTMIEAAGALGVKYVTLYAFSTENWNRPQEEVDMLMSLFVQSIKMELPNLMKNKVKLAAIGNLAALPEACLNELHEAIHETAQNTGLTLVLALSYSARWEITEMVRRIARKVETHQLDASSITNEDVVNHLDTSPIPDPDILIRTGGELRLSNFLLWQLAYTELFFSDKMWPDFRKEDLHKIILDYQSRERRYGKISEQVISH